MTGDKDSRARYRANLQGEIDGAALYQTLAKAEKNPDIAKVYFKLAAIEEAHAEFWRSRLRASGSAIPNLQPDLRTRALGWLARRFGPQFVLPTVNTLKQLDSSQYDRQPDAAEAGLPKMERSHARIIEALARGNPQVLTGGAFARLEGRHRGVGGNALRAAVLGANDGLCSNLSLVMGVAGAAINRHGILVTGVAGLIAGACSMALGEGVSVTSARELAEREIRIESSELDEDPKGEGEELQLIYESKGLSADEAKRVVDQMLSDKTATLDALAREELGIDPTELGGSAWEAALAP